MFTPPQGPELTPDQARELDDEFFRSRPFEYFAARMASLISSAGSTEVDTTGELGAEFTALLGGSADLPFDDSDRKLQVATDAFALRHHAAEALVRVYHALTMSERTGETPRCVWEAIADGPRQTVDLVDDTRTYWDSETGHDTFWRLVLPPSAGDSQPEYGIITALKVMFLWLRRAMTLLTRNDININAGHNKVKHGLAVRQRGDERLTFVTQPPNPDGAVPLSALTGPDAVDILDTVALHYLARPPKENGRKQGLEVSTLRLPTATLMAEAWMMAVTYGRMFHYAAARHFEGREIQFAPCPPLPQRPTPEQLLNDSVVGLRQPVTTPPDGRGIDRELGVALQKRFVTLKVDFANKTSGTVVDG